MDTSYMSSCHRLSFQLKVEAKKILESVLIGFIIQYQWDSLDMCFKLLVFS